MQIREIIQGELRRALSDEHPLDAPAIRYLSSCGSVAALSETRTIRGFKDLYKDYCSPTEIATLHYHDSRPTLR